MTNLNKEEPQKSDKDEPRIGMYICHCGKNIAGTVDSESVAEYAATLPNVVTAKDYLYTCSEPGQNMIRDDIKELGINRVVVAACTPKMHEQTFRKTISDAGLNPYVLEVANIREQCSWCHMKEKENATEKAKDLVRMAISRSRDLVPLERTTIPVDKSALVIGGGIAGIETALDMADAGLKVYLVERETSIGGKMAQLDKTFPTLDCSACILTPKMVNVSRHPDITLLTYSEVKNVDGYVGNFKVTVERKPRYVIEEACTGCGECSFVCPVRVPNEFDMNRGKRAAIYVPFPQAVPLKFTIDPEHCLYFKNKMCTTCKQLCPKNAVDYDQEPEILDLTVGSIVVASGCDTFDATKIPELGYGRYPNVITNMDFERIVNAGGPTEGHILRPSDNKEPKSVAIIQCVGARDEENELYCCRYGCMAAMKQAYLLKEKLGSDTDVYICYIDLRSFGKGYEEFYRKVRNMGVKFIRGQPSEVLQNPDGSLVFNVYNSNIARHMKITVDIVILTLALTPPKGIDELQRILRISRGADGYFLEAHVKLQPAETHTKGIMLAGTCMAPRDITDTVTHAANAAAKAIDLLAPGEVPIEPITAWVDEDICSGCGICWYICPYAAIKIVDVEGHSSAEVIDALCTGCGTCGAACPSNAITHRHYTSNQIMDMVIAALEG